MAKKRKSLATSLDEVDRTVHSSFCSAANSLSQLYTQAMNKQKFSFQAGERHGLEKLYQRILRQQEGGSRMNTADVLNYLQAELDCYGEELSPRVQLQNHQVQHAVQLPNSGSLVSSGSPQDFRTEDCEQASKNHVFSNALSSPVRRSLQKYHIADGGFAPNGVQPSVNGVVHSNNQPDFLQNQVRDFNSLNFNDSSMDMLSES